MAHAVWSSTSRASSDTTTNPTHSNGSRRVGVPVAARVDGVTGLMVAAMAAFLPEAFLPRSASRLPDLPARA
jgi:hypothetical protein